MGPLAVLKLFRASLLVQLREAFAQSTLHGVRFITERGRPFWEKFCWFCIVSISTGTTLIIIFNFWQRFQTKPTITGPDTGFQHNWTSFPTVLVCPTDVVDVARAERVVPLVDPTLNYTEVAPFVSALAGISYRHMVPAEDVGSLDGSVKKVRNFIFYVAIGCQNLLSNCWFRGLEVDCCSQFKSVFSELGFCYGFNAKFYDTMERWERTTEFNYLIETDKKLGLKFELSRPSHIFIHPCNEISSLQFYPLTRWEEEVFIDILISKKETYTTEDARQLSIGQRRCIFPDEVKPKYYPDDYTFSGCMAECRIRKSHEYCKCIPPFYAPSDELPFCTVGQLSCLAKNAANITSSSGCQKCELACHSTVYDIEKYSKSSTIVSKDAVVKIEYLTWPLIRYKREVLFGWVDLLVSFGGIAGLFLGFSLLSGVEIIYFFTMRACCMLYKNRDELNAIEQKKLNRSQHRYDLSLKPHFRNLLNRKATTQPQHKGPIKQPFNNRHLITVGMIEMEFEAVKVPASRGLLLAGSPKRYISRYDRIMKMGKRKLFYPTLVAPYSEKIQPLDRNVLGDVDGLFYKGYLP